MKTKLIKVLKHSFLTALALVLTSQSAFADEEPGLLKEVGITFLTPGIVNLNLGIWGTEAVPLVVRTSGMYYGDVKGFQLDVGYALSRSENFKHYIGGHFIAVDIDTTRSQLSMTAAGPSYGLNWHGFSLQAGLAFGSTMIDGLPVTTPQLTTQLGYTVIW